jgi:hypothetical protein
MRCAAPFRSKTSTVRWHRVRNLFNNKKRLKFPSRMARGDGWSHVYRKLPAINAKNIFLLSLQIIRRVDWRNSKHPKKATNAVKKLALKFNDRHLKAEWFNDNFRDNFITSTKKRWWGTTMCAIGFTIATSIRMYLARGQFIKVES